MHHGETFWLRIASNWSRENVLRLWNEEALVIKPVQQILFGWSFFISSVWSITFCMYIGIGIGLCWPFWILNYVGAKIGSLFIVQIEYWPSDRFSLCTASILNINQLFKVTAFASKGLNARIWPQFALVLKK